MGDTALVPARLSYSPDQGGVARQFALRGGYVARLADKRRMLVPAR